jgi:hypothetical protein
MFRPGATSAFAPPRTYSRKLKIKPPATISMRLSRSTDVPIFQSYPKLPTATATTHRRPRAPNPPKSKRPGLLITPVSSSSPSAQPSSSSKTAPSSSYVATFAKAMALGLTTSSTRAFVASSHTSARSTATRHLRRTSCGAALIV